VTTSLEQAGVAEVVIRRYRFGLEPAAAIEYVPHQAVASGEERKGIPMTKHKAATPEEWLAARGELLARERS
jgi:hypothetical protein